QAATSQYTTNITYDDAGRLYTSTQVQGSATTTYTYTKDRLTSRADPAGTTSFGYDSYGRISSVTTPFSTTPVAYTFDDAGRELTRTDPSGLATTRGYDAYTGRLLYETVKAGSTTKASFGTPSTPATYDPVGNLLTVPQTLNTNPDNGTW